MSHARSVRPHERSIWQRVVRTALPLGAVLALAAACGSDEMTVPADPGSTAADTSTEPADAAPETSEPTAEEPDMTEPASDPDLDCPFISVEQLPAPMVGDWVLETADETSCEFGNDMSAKQVTVVTVVPVGDAPDLTQRRSKEYPDQAPIVESFDPPGANGAWLQYSHEDVVWGMYFELDAQAVLIEEYYNSYNGEWREIQATIIANLGA